MRWRIMKLVNIGGQDKVIRVIVKGATSNCMCMVCDVKVGAGPWFATRVRIIESPNEAGGRAFYVIVVTRRRTCDLEICGATR
jgi:hypothetical protein